MRRWTAIVADDDIDSRALVSDALSDLAYEVVIATSPDEITSAATRLGSRVILASPGLKDLDPTQLRRDLVRAPGHSHLILLLDRYSRKSVTSAFEAGADDVLVKPLIAAELSARLRHAARVLALEDMCAHVESEAALFDAISAHANVHSRRFFDAQLASELARASRFAHPISLVLAHVSSDPWDERDMRALGRVLSSRFRSNVDWMARYDEHRLAFVLPETGLPGALRATQRLDSALSGTQLTSIRLPDNLSVNYGVISLDSQPLSRHNKPPDIRLLMEAAEANLEDAISSGQEIVAGRVPQH